MRRLSLIGAWFLVLILTTTLTWQIVSAADDRVSDRPASPLNVAAPVVGADSTPTTIRIQTTTTSIPDEGTSTTTPPVTTTTTSPPTSTTTTTPPPSTTTTKASAWSIKTVSTTGGTVVLKYRPDEVVYQSATPAAGFQVEVEDPGPPKVEIEFESETMKVSVHAKWADGKLDVEIDESSEEDD